MFYDNFVDFIPAKQSGSQLYACCPFHADTNASFTVNSESNEWYCHGCSMGGKEVQFIEEYFDVDKHIAENAFAFYEGKGLLPFPTEEYIQACHERLLSKPKEIDVLHTFGITDETISKYRLGLDDIRITIPIKGRTGQYINIRKYLPPHRRIPNSNNSKVVQIRGLGAKRYFPYEAFDTSQQIIYIVEGEKDCLAARSQGLNAVTCTCGSNIPIYELGLFKDKIVYLMLDTDATGNRTCKQYAQMLRTIAKEIHVINLPLKDFSDYWQRYQDINISEYEIRNFEAKDLNEDDGQSTNLSLGKSEYVEHLNSWVQLDNMSVVGTDPKTYTVPRKLKVICRDLHCTRPCAVGSSRVPVEVEVDPRQLLQFVDSSDSAQDSYIRKMYGCKSLVSEPSEYTNIQKIMFQETASFVDGLEEASFEHRYGIFLYEESRLLPTSRYNFDACRVTDPRSQQNYYVIKSARPVSNDLSSTLDFDTNYFRAVAQGCKSLEELLQFHYDVWMAACGIEGRLDLFASIILTYLSVTEINWKGGKLKGWLDTMVIGDTRTGKSQMAQRFVKAMGKGSYINGENARRTGVIGGVQRLGDSWIITWGAIPMNDKGLLIIDEASGLDIEDIKELSATRSSGAITINKIAKGEAKARTRLIWLSNPRSGRNIEDFYWKGYGAFQEFIPVVEDQARYDLVLTAAREDVSELHGIPEESKIPTEKWKALINFAWSVEAENVIISKETKEAIEETCKQLEKDYGGGPLVVGVAVHEKILRLSCAFAVLCGDIEEEKLQIRPKYVEYAYQMLHMVFDKPTMDYKGYIQEYKKAQRRKTENNDFIKVLCTQNPALKILLSSNLFRGSQVREVLGIDQLEASRIISDLLKRGLIRITGSGAYAPDKMLIDMAKQMEVSL